MAGIGRKPNSAGSSKEVFSRSRLDGAVTLRTILDRAQRIGVVVLQGVLLGLFEKLCR
jgi:hypothetical protein